MLTKNGKNIFVGSYQSGGYPQMQGRHLKATDGSDYTITGSNSAMYTIMGSIFLQVGSGTTGATVNDYNLESEISSLTIMSSSNSGNRNPINYDDNFIYNVSRSFKNNTENPITVTEVGVFATYSNRNYLVAREVITPIIIDPQKTYTFNLAIS